MKKISIIALIAGAIGISACGDDTDAGKGVRDTGDAKAIINMPNHFNNVAVKCYQGNGIYVTNNNGDGGSGSSLAVVIKDPVCGGVQ